MGTVSWNQLTPSVAAERLLEDLAPWDHRVWLECAQSQAAVSGHSVTLGRLGMSHTMPAENWSGAVHTLTELFLSNLSTFCSEQIFLRAKGCNRVLSGPNGLIKLFLISVAQPL